MMKKRLCSEINAFKNSDPALFTKKMAESIDLFIEDQAFSPSRHLIDSFSTSSPYPVSKLSLLKSLPVCRRSSLLTQEEEGGRVGAKSYDGEKA
jgi:hypothetical protein